MLNQLNRRVFRDQESSPAIIATRKKLTAALTLYVRTDGNDANSGLANTATGAFMTIQRAINVATQEYDAGGWGITIQIADGTYSVSSQITLNPFWGTPTITIQGNTTTPASVVINFTTSNSHGFYMSRAGGGVYYLRGFRLTGTTGTTNYAIASEAGFIHFDNIEFNTGWLVHLIALAGGKIYAIGNYAIIPATVGYHLYSASFGFVQVAGITLTLAANTAFTQFAFASPVGLVSFFGNTVTNIGTSTGSRGTASGNGVVNLAGAAQTTLPGNVNVTVASGGQVI